MRDTHQTLFKGVYPWAGETRDQNAPDLNITKGSVTFQPAPAIPTGVDYALNQGNDPATLRANPGAVLGNLAFAHPFLDGNGRSLLVVHGELANRAGIHIDWSQTNKQDYLRALTKEIDDPQGKHLDTYLKPFVREGRLTPQERAEQLAKLPGLSIPQAAQTAAEKASGAAREAPQAANDERPTLHVVAGPNGAGKSSFTRATDFGRANIIDPDRIAEAINPANPESASFDAGRQAIQQRQTALQNGQSFVVETTLSGNATLKLIDQAKAAGFQVNLTFIGIDSPQQARERVNHRVESGGHNIPTDDINRRFQRSFDNLPAAIQKSDQATLYNNSGSSREKVAELNRDQWSFADNTPKWAAGAGVKVAQREIQSAQAEAEAR